MSDVDSVVKIQSKEQLSVSRYLSCYLAQVTVLYFHTVCVTGWGVAVGVGGGHMCAAIS